MPGALESARGGAQARALRPGGPACRVIVTSRARLAAMEGAHVTELDVMDADEALLLLERMAPAERVRSEPEAAARLITLADRLPPAPGAPGARLAVPGPHAARPLRAASGHGPPPQGVPE